MNPIKPRGWAPLATFGFHKDATFRYHLLAKLYTIGRSTCLTLAFNCDAFRSDVALARLHVRTYVLLRDVGHLLDRTEST